MRKRRFRLNFEEKLRLAVTFFLPYTLRRQWNKYSREYDYAKEISFDDTCDAIQKIMDEIIK